MTARPPSSQRSKRTEAHIERIFELRRQASSHARSARRSHASFAQDRADAVERRSEREAAEILGRPEPHLNRWELTRDVAAREKAKETTPATQAELSKLSQTVTSLKAKLHALSGRG